ncbi:hypothetical protein [Mesorhizobium sp. M1B.F.Ca.ET.045.04.1.1]|uniref:hypothetical protein n=1 Tax=Mesorhizobium sp. M1B.F.Ca.ET.045.04.1.1 TaxID=2493673 RepID=UPI000F76253B|nr:hypothetical protein [Mesorhizobium sp. M1B.F.Ca.ET.045.04.1.1]AZO26750.1 hypothetical protein EJ071_04095 [Mesorhizobium sp. M1B.F.Ca.ET.045.04.1.1]
MSKSLIASVGFECASSSVEYISFGSSVSLLDFDVTLFRPQIDDYTGYYDTYNGKPCLDDDRSFALRRYMDHWRREIVDAVNGGKTIIVFMTDLSDLSVATGEKKYSGSGRNSRVTRLVMDYDNYRFLPYALKLTPSIGRGMVLATEKSEPLNEYWREFGEASTYKVIINDASSPGHVLTRNGNKSVGLIVRSKVSNGALVLLPDLNLDAETFTVKGKDNQTLWSKEAQAFFPALVAAVVSIDKAIKSSGEVTPEPKWSATGWFKLRAEIDIESKLASLNAELDRINEESADLKSRLSDVSLLRGLLYEKGPQLEKAIIKALRILGYSAEKSNVDNIELDVVFASDEGRLIGEAEGKDSKPVNITKLRQLALNVHEDFEREDVEKIAKGVLFGNGYRLSPLEEREEPFTEKCLSASVASSAALVSTPELFLVAQYLSDNADPDFARKCRLAIGSTVGRVLFPPVPQIAVPQDLAPSEA